MRLTFLIIFSLLLFGCGKKSDPPKESTEQAEPQKPAWVDRNSDVDVKPTTPTETSESIAPELKRAKPADSPLLNKRWKLIEMNGENVEVTEAFQSDPYVTLSMHSNKVHGSGGCNRFGGTYSLDGDKLTFVHLLATKKFCEGASEVENQFLSELRAATGFRVVGDAMWILREGKQVMKFEAIYLQ